MTNADDPYRLKELADREARAREMGGADKLARQQSKGRLNARQRVEQLLDPDSFDEHGLLAVSDLPQMADKTPADGKVAGFGAIEERTVFVSADDVTVLAGAGGRVGTGKQFKGMQYAMGSTPLMRTLQRRPKLAIRSVHVEAKEV